MSHGAPVVPQRAPVSSNTHGAEQSPHSPFPLRDVQQAYWVGRSLRGEPAHSYLELEGGALDVARLEEAWNRVVARHAALRSVVTADGQQRVLEEVPRYRIGLLDLSALSEAEAEARSLTVRAEVQRPRLSTHQFPLFEIRATRLPRGRTRLHVCLDLLFTDARSTDLKLQEWLALYENADARLPELRSTWRDYVLTETAYRQSEEYEAARRYWLEKLPTFPGAPELPQPLQRAGAGQDGRLEEHTRLSWALDAERTSRLRARAEKSGLNVTRVILAAFADTIATWSGRPEFALSLPTARRMPFVPGAETLVGNFTNPLLLGLNCASRRDGDTFESRAHAHNARLIADLKASQFSGIDFLRELARVRGGMAQAAVPVVFNRFVQSFAAPEGISLGYQVLRTPLISLEHQLAEERDGLKLVFFHQPSHYPPGMVDGMFESYCDLVTRLSEGEDAWRDRVRWVPRPVRLRAREEANATAAPVPDGLLHDAFVRQALNEPSRAAVITAERTLSYGEVLGRSRHLAHRLKALGAKPNGLVAVALPKGWEQVVSVMGVLQSGAAYLPIDPSLPKDRIHAILAQGRVKLALAQPSFCRGFEWPEGVTAVPVSDEDADDLTALPLPVVNVPDDLAYVIFTSGSTGVPKGVMIDHRGALNTCADVNARFGVQSADRIFGISSLGFDLSVWDLFGGLAAGAAIVLPEPEATRDPARWSELMREHRVTVWNSAPPLMSMLMTWAGSRPDALPDSLRLVMLSGDWIPLALPDQLRARVPSVRVVSLGGATEASIWSILYEVNEVDPAWRSIPYGKAMRNQTFHVFSPTWDECPDWVPGRLYIGGIGLAKGYFGDEAKTNERFVHHPRTGERLYHTGDLGRFYPDGNIEFLGREDFQVKVNGYRIELGEIEATLTTHSSVRDAVVMARDDGRGDKRLVAYCIAREDGELDATELRSYVRARLPEYMVPSAVVTLQTFPLSSSGKVDRRALPAPDRGAALSERVPPNTQTERLLAQIWSEVLGVPEVGIRHDFLELGGDSMLAIQVLARANDAGLRLNARHLFQHQTIEALARVADAAASGDTVEQGSPALVEIRRVEGSRPFFCVHPVGGHVLSYAELSRAMPERSFYGLQSPGLEHDGWTFESLTAMAASYLDAIREVQPEGPYLLGGWSLGGVIAWEMAQQLRAKGEEVAALVLIDSEVPSTDTRVTDTDDASLLSLFAMDFAGRTGATADVTREELSALPDSQRFAHVVERLRALGVVPANANLADLSRTAEVFKSNVRAVMGYEPPQWNGPVVLLQGEESTPFAKWGGWESKAKDLVIHTVPGDHYSMLAKPRVESLAQRVREALAAGHGFS